MTTFVRRKAGDPLSPEALERLERLAELPDDQIDLSDIPEMVFTPREEAPLEEHTVTLRVDAEVAAWLETAATNDPAHLNSLLKRAAHRSRLLESASSLEKAS